MMIDHFSHINPGLVLIVVGLVACLVPQRRLRQVLTLIVPVIALVMLVLAEQDTQLATMRLAGMMLVPYQVDSLSFVFALAFLIATFINAVYALHSDDRLQDGMALVYAGAAIAATLSGDLFSLFVFWEMTAVSSVFLIFRAGTRAAFQAGMRYLGIQILSGVLLLYGLVCVYHASGHLQLAAFTSFDQPGARMVFAALAIKAAFPFVHNWLQDAYPKATVIGAVVLSAFTTKLAVYAFARMFPGFEVLIWIGAIMTVFPVFFAVVEDDLRKVLSYSLNNQLGFMICAIGIGTPLALNGATAHAFAHIIYKSLLFMSMGAVLYRVGSARVSDLGGLYRSMPWTAVFCMIGAASISAFPLFSGFIAKSMTMSAVAGNGDLIVWLMLLFASAGVLEHSGIKVPYFTFFSHDSGKRVAEAPFNMRLAMGMAAFICIAIGLPALAPGFGFDWLYALLPYQDAATGYARNVYSLDHVLTQMQLLVFAVLAFMLLKRFRLYPEEKPGVILDSDWFYRKPIYGLAAWVYAVCGKIAGVALRNLACAVTRFFRWVELACSPHGQWAHKGMAGGMAMWSAVLLAVLLAVALLTV